MTGEPSKCLGINRRKSTSESIAQSFSEDHSHRLAFRPPAFRIVHSDAHAVEVCGQSAFKSSRGALPCANQRECAMPGRFDSAADPTERILSQLKDAIRDEEGKSDEPARSTRQHGKGRTTRKVEILRVVIAASVMMVVFVLLLLWLR
jgi:hypothetical protein